MNERFTVTASSLGNYFNVGFVDPMTQLEIDLGEKEPTFTKAQLKKMELGKCLEEGSLNYFEKIFETKIYNRNEEKHTGLDGKLRYIVDGEAIINGERMVVENKISSYDFTENLGYHFQVQAYMECMGCDKALLCGLVEGEPHYKIIEKDPEMIADLKEMVNSVYCILNGLLDKEDFPWDLVEKYKKEEEPVEEIKDLATGDRAFMDELFDLNQQAKVIEKRSKELKSYLSSKYKNTSWMCDEYKFSAVEQTRKGGLDVNRLEIEHPEIDFNDYKKDDTKSVVIRFGKAK